MPDRRADEMPRPFDDYGHKFSRTWVQMAIIAMNSASEASAAASWMRVLNMVLSLEHQTQRQREGSGRAVIS
jgi:hypothetical protein